MNRVLRTILMAALALPMTLALHAPAAAGAEVAAAEAVRVVTGKEGGYRTVVERRSHGELSPENFRQVSLLSSRILLHVADAAEALADGRAAEARAELTKARSLAKIVRSMLPVTEVTTTVLDPSGREVYRDTERVQDDLIPIYSEMIVAEVVEPILQAKEEQAAVKGLQLTDADLIFTSMLLDLSYVERKIASALSLLDRKRVDDALAELVLAQTVGVQLHAVEQDDPLVKAQLALRLAERNVEEGKLEGARANLAQARLHLETYRTLVGKERASEVAALERRLAELSGRLEQPGALDRLREYWSQLAGWRTREPGEAHATTAK